MKFSTGLAMCTCVLASVSFASVGAASDVMHLTHFAGIKGDFGLFCLDCHDVQYSPDGSSSLIIREETCVGCHSPDGSYDGLYDPEIGVLVRENWPVDNGESRIFDIDGKLRPGKEKWCLGCHDDGVSEIHDVPAPNIAGKSLACSWQSPVAIVESGFQGAQNLIDNDVYTGNTDGGAAELIFDLGSTLEISHIRFYTVLDTLSYWEIYGGNDLVSWERILYGQYILYGLPVLQVGEEEGWNQFRLDKSDPVRYIKLVKKLPVNLPIHTLCEFEYKKDLSYGYMINGHKISCDNCHDTSSVHVDGVSQTYKAELNNYSAGYRLADVVVDYEAYPALEIPRVGNNSGEYPRTDNDFALCFKCHDKYKLLGDAYGTGGFFQYPLETNFRNDENVDSYGNVSNEHLRHLRGRGVGGNIMDWDSDWNGVPDSPQSCTACHNVHGSPNPVMTRHGELASTPGTSDKVPMFNFRFLSQDGVRDEELSNVMESSGGQTQFYGAGAGSVQRNFMCNMCHNDLKTYNRTPELNEINFGPLTVIKDSKHDKHRHVRDRDTERPNTKPKKKHDRPRRKK